MFLLTSRNTTKNWTRSWQTAPSFYKLPKNPVDDIKCKTNRITKTVSAALHLPSIVGDYELGCIYGNVKTHKQCKPLCPIISQIPAPIYHLAKRLNIILIPYVPGDHSLKSSAEFLEALRPTAPCGISASMDVESPFTNVPVNETIQIILDCVYRDPTTPSLKVPEHTLCALLKMCTIKAPFSTHRGNMYTQINSIAMGSLLGVLFVNFYLATIEKRVFTNIRKAQMHVRYIDDTFISTETSEEIENLRYAFHTHNCLNFTNEYSHDRHLPFLDVLVKQWEEYFTKKMYTKPTNLVICINGKSEFPKRYKQSAISAFIRRALSHSSSWTDTHGELESAARILIDNGHTNWEVDKCIRGAMNRWCHQEPRPKSSEDIKLFYLRKIP
ncbi:uncharacterized protein [Macrobrachium rosenbergii]|uniref:uncharacterized protein n=1 Tax=Macrobrachium rosenbergii TaxID=79674 RepID=UPI0034D44488